MKKLIAMLMVCIMLCMTACGTSAVAMTVSTIDTETSVVLPEEPLVPEAETLSAAGEEIVPSSQNISIIESEEFLLDEEAETILAEEPEEPSIVEESVFMDESIMKPTETEADNAEENTEETWPTYTTLYATTTVNVRTGPGKDYESIGMLYYGNEVSRIDENNSEWVHVLYDGIEAYVYGTYLTGEEPPAASDTTGYPMVYSDETCTVTIYKEWFENAWCYAAHLEFTDYTRFGTSCANGAYNNGSETTSSAASRLGAILCVNGCYSAPYLDYIVVRSGTLCNGSSRNLWIPAFYSSYTGCLASAWETGSVHKNAGKNVQSLVSSGELTDTFCFGPPMLMGGSVVNCSDSSRAQRTFIGTNGTAGDIWLVVSDGRYNDGESAGLTYGQCARYLISKGCTFGVPLDGGGSSTMVFQGMCLNAERGNERAVVDFVYFK